MNVMMYWSMNSMMSVEVGIVLNSMDIMVSIMSWVELVGMRVVIIRTVLVFSNVVVSIMVWSM